MTEQKQLLERRRKIFTLDLNLKEKIVFLRRRFAVHGTVSNLSKISLIL